MHNVGSVAFGPGGGELMTGGGDATARIFRTRDGAELGRLAPCFDLLPFAEAARRRCCLLAAPDRPALVVTDPGDGDLVAWALSRFGPFDLRRADDPAFDAWLARAEAGAFALGAGATAGAAAVVLPSAPAGESLSLQSIDADASPAIRFVNSTLYDALKSGASDVHLEGDPGGLTVKFRIDGVLSPIRRLDSPELAAHSISRIKVMAQLDIAERRRGHRRPPQRADRSRRQRRRVGRAHEPAAARGARPAGPPSRRGPRSMPAAPADRRT